jgi:hypothetical protein
MTLMKRIFADLIRVNPFNPCHPRAILVWFALSSVLCALSSMNTLSQATECKAMNHEL